MQKLSIQELEIKANEIRQDIIRMLVEAGSGHSAGPLGMADIFAALYFHILNHDPKSPDWEDRDRLILSNGHICPVRYAAMAEAGYFPKGELATLRKLGSRLQGHPERLKLPGVETTSGPLGSGLAQSAGYAYAARMDGKTFRVFCVMSDAEQEAGNTWEAAMFAGKNNLSSLTAIIDRNNIQIDGYTEDVMPLEPLVEKYKAFNWSVVEIDGHNMQEIIDACGRAEAIHENPTVIIAHTIPGKGVSYMENDFKWHGTPPGITDMKGEPAKNDQIKIALHDLRTLGGKIKSEHE
ncbi:MAG: Transketolase domain protein [Candidatus Woesebacteria bacterium GW2011_GWB1_45_5]|uniref:Transketolase domain protein n=1 Tax=Candidatus Woesebacteria bacterium GW2011_GWB1_45_5 TaxID=1618581 RepID=A0A0G1PXM2_9BACT|nr:MAG: Transketolase domain protein [Candidatus Woesebacteria bacterium GW2011_GWB1_45_5]